MDNVMSTQARLDGERGWTNSAEKRDIFLFLQEND